jgi:hypothetical protein
LNALPNVTQNRSCHEKCRTARIYVIVRDGTLNASTQYFQLTPSDQHEVSELVKVLHPYGSIGDYHLDGIGTNNFGGKYNADRIIEESEKIRTFTEGVNTKVQNRIVSSLKKAETVSFFGFRYLDLNMKYLFPDNDFLQTGKAGVTGYPQNILGTVKGISKDSTKQIEKKLASILTNRSSIQYPNPDKVSLMDCTCNELLHEFEWRLAT